MARGRMLSKTISCSRRFNDLPNIAGTLGEFSQLLFTMLIPHVDDFGRMTGDPMSVKLTVLPASVRPISDIAAALHALHTTALITVYEHNGDIWLQVNKFDDHQTGLHKRTESKIPGPPLGQSGNFPELPGNSWSRARPELNLTELNLTEQKIYPQLENQLVRNRGGSNKESRNGQRPDGRSKRPVFTGQRLTVFEWMLDDCEKTLGPLTESFDLHEWFFELDRKLAQSNVVIQKRDGGAWLNAQLVAEAQRRGLQIATAETVKPHVSKQVQRLASIVQRMKSTS